MTTNPTIAAILVAAGLLAIGLTLRLRLRVLRVLYIPAAVIAGAFGLALAQSGSRVIAPLSQTLSGMIASVVSEWSTWPTMLIAVVFSGLLLERSQDGGFADALRRGARSGILAWIIILGQILIGLVVYLLVRTGHPDVPATFAQLLEISWAGGHGSAAGMGALYAQQGFAEGRDLAFFCATVGLIYGVVSGLVFVNVAIRRGWTSGGGGSLATREAGASGTQPTPVPIAFGTIRGEVMEPMVLTIVLIAAAVSVGLLLQRGFLHAAGMVLGTDNPASKVELIDYAANVPLFLFTLLGGWVVRRVAEGVGIARLIDAASIGRFVGIAMDFLIVAGIATMRIESISRFAWPLVLLMILAAAWSAFCLLVLAPLLLPKAYWFELGLLNYGFSTANTPQGMMLLRIVDPDLRTNAAADYAVAAPLSAPFIGGGIVTFLVLPVMLQRVAPTSVMLIVASGIIALIAVGRRLSRGSRPGPDAAVSERS